MGLFGCKTDDKIEYFPKKEIVLVKEFESYSNFFPIGKINLKQFGIDRKIPLVYVFFDHSEEGFFKNDDIDHFSFILEVDGKLKPTFQTKSLKMSDSYQKYLDKSIEKYNNYKKLPNSWLIDFSASPEWWQDDETPKNSKGIDMKFICQIDSDEFTEDDCRMFVFFNNENSEIRIIYQRT